MSSNFVDKPWGNPVRPNDPETSHTAARDVVVRAGSQRALMLEVFYRAWCEDELGELTSDDAFNIGRIKYAMPLSQYSYWKRVSELQQMQLISPTGHTSASNSGAKQRCFAITQSGIDEMRKVKSSIE